MKVNISQCYNILFDKFQGISANAKGDIEKAKTKLKENKLRYLIGHVEPLAEGIAEKIDILRNKIEHYREYPSENLKEDIKSVELLEKELAPLLKEYNRYNDEIDIYKSRLINLRAFISKYTNNEQLGKLLFGEDFKLQNADPIDSHAEFNVLNTKYKYFDSYEEISMDFQKCYKVALYIAIVIEKSNINEVGERAYKMCALFAKNKDILGAVDQFLAKHSGNYPNPVHDTFQNNLPVFKGEDGKEKFKLLEWRKNLMPMGLLLIQNLESLDKVEELTNGEIPKTAKQLDKVLAKIAYARHEEDHEFADLCRFYRVSEDVFNRALDLIKNGIIKIRDKDDLISVVIDLSQLKASKKDTYLLRLPKNDKRGLILGKITDCCQSVGGHSEMCVIDGMNLDNNGFYVIAKMKNQVHTPQSTSDAVSNISSTSSAYSEASVVSHDISIPKNVDEFERNGNKIIGQFYCWRSREGNICIDSFEPLGDSLTKEEIKETLEAFADKVMEQDPTVSRVTLGKGGKTPTGLFETARVADSMKEGHMYGDALDQYEIKASSKLIQLREEVNKKLGIETSNRVISVRHAEYLLSLNDDVVKEITKDVLELGISYDFRFFLSPLFIGKIDKLIDMRNKDSKRWDLITTAPNPNILTGESNICITGLTVGLFTLEEITQLNLDVLDYILRTSSYDPNTPMPYYMYQALDCIAICQIGLKEIVADTVPQVMRNIVKAYAKKYTAEIKLGFVNKFSDELIAYFFEMGLRNFMETNLLQASDLIDFDLPKFQKLFDGIIMHDVIMMGKIKIAELLKLDLEKAKLCVGIEALSCYRTKKVSFADLKDLPINKIKTISKAYHVFTQGVEFKDIKDLDDEFLEIINSKVTIETCKAGVYKLQDLIKMKDANNVRNLVLNAIFKHTKSDVKVIDTLSLIQKKSIVKMSYYGYFLKDGDDLSILQHLKTEREFELLDDMFKAIYNNSYEIDMSGKLLASAIVAVHLYIEFEKSIEDKIKKPIFDFTSAPLFMKSIEDTMISLTKPELNPTNIMHKLHNGFSNRIIFATLNSIHVLKEHAKVTDEVLLQCHCSTDIMNLYHDIVVKNLFNNTRYEVMPGEDQRMLTQLLVQESSEAAQNIQKQ